MNDKPDRGKGLVAFPEMRRGQIGLVVATQIARYGKPGRSIAGWHSQEQAWAQTQGQLAWYRTMEEEGYLKQIISVRDLNEQLKLWEEKNGKEEKAIGYLLSLEGADSLVHLDYLQTAYGYGLRAIGPAHYGPGVYAGGTEYSGGFTKRGFELLQEMENLGMILDVTHLSDQGFWEAMDIYRGPVWASHNNCRSLVPGQRQFSDEQIRALAQRESVIGVAMDAWMMVPGWIRGSSDPLQKGLDLKVVADHIDHICQITGNANCAGIGSDLDGAFGKEQCPYDVETIADIQKLRGILKGRGYSEADTEQIMYGNLVRFLNRALQ
jgi:membrane dipeptidase